MGRLSRIRPRPEYLNFYPVFHSRIVSKGGVCFLPLCCTTVTTKRFSIIALPVYRSKTSILFFFLKRFGFSVQIFLKLQRKAKLLMWSSSFTVYSFSKPTIRLITTFMEIPETCMKASSSKSTWLVKCLRTQP